MKVFVENIQQLLIKINNPNTEPEYSLTKTCYGQAADVCVTSIWKLKNDKDIYTRLHSEDSVDDKGRLFIGHWIMKMKTNESIPKLRLAPRSHVSVIVGTTIGEHMDE